MNAILCGSCGKMGNNVTSLANEYGITIVCGIDLFPTQMPYPVYSSLSEVKEDAQIIIDFSSPNGLEERLNFCKQKGMGIVLCPTGYTEWDEALIKEYAKQIPIFKTGNFSLGINLMQLFVKRAAQVLGENFDIEIIERHHNQKKDAPSGTALMLANSANEGLTNGKRLIYGREGMVGARSQDEIAIHAVRGGTIVGEHEVMFAGEDEIITLSHSARSRKVFASGALKAAIWLSTQSAGLYDMSDLLGALL